MHVFTNVCDKRNCKTVWMHVMHHYLGRVVKPPSPLTFETGGCEAQTFKPASQHKGDDLILTSKTGSTMD